SSGVGLSPGRGAPSCCGAAALLAVASVLCLSPHHAAGVAVWASRRIVAPTGIAPAGRRQVGPVTCVRRPAVLAARLDPARPARSASIADTTGSPNTQNYAKTAPGVRSTAASAWRSAVCLWAEHQGRD